MNRLILVKTAEIAMIGTTGSAPIKRHQHQRHQRAGAIAGKAADQGSKQRDAGHQHELAERDIGKTGQNTHSRWSRVKRATV